jgi:hypothetical protein
MGNPREMNSLQLRQLAELDYTWVEAYSKAQERQSATKRRMRRQPLSRFRPVKLTRFGLYRNFAKAAKKYFVRMLALGGASAFGA